MFEGALENAVAPEVDIVWNFFGVIDHLQAPEICRRGRARLCRAPTLAPS